MQQSGKNKVIRRSSLLAALLVCLSPAFSVADGITDSIGNAQQADADQPLVLLPLQNSQTLSGLTFDLGGSETRRLEMQLSEPLKVNINNHTVKSPTGVGSVFLDSSLSLRLNDNIDITSSLGAGRSQAGFQPLGSIHCQNGVLDQGLKSR